MATSNRPNKLTVDASSDTNLALNINGGYYNSFTNQLTTPLIGVKGVTLLSANFVNSGLQLNDQSQLMFFYYSANNTTNFRSTTNLRMIRLLPSNFVPFNSTYTTYTKNRYFNNCDELVSALNAAASTGGDENTSNPLYLANDITFSYNSSTRKITMSPVDPTTRYISPAAHDDPWISDLLKNVGVFAGANYYPVMKTVSATHDFCPAQPYVVGQTMNSRLGWGMSINTTPIWNNNFTYGCAWQQGSPIKGSIEADCNPILLSSQNVNIYADIVTGSGNDSRNYKNLVASIPITTAPLNVNAYTLSSNESNPLTSVFNEIYAVTITMLDEYGIPFLQPPNYNVQLSFGIYY